MRVALSGYYGFGNHGDEALLAGLVAGLRGHGHEPVVLSADPGRTRALHGVEARSRTTGLLPALASVDAVVSGGGGLLQDATSARSLAYYLGVVRLARMLGKRTVVYGQSVGPLGPRGRAWVRGALRGIPASVRDGPSQALLGSLGIASHRCADAALLLSAPHVMSHARQGRDGQHARQGRDGPHARQGRDGPSARRGREAPVVLVPRSGYPVHTAALAELAARLAERGVPVRGVALHPRDDAEAAGVVQRAGGGGAPAVPGDWREALREVARARVVLSTRLHALVFAAVAAVPHAGLVYDPKVAGFLEDSGGAAFHAPFPADGLLQAATDPPDVDVERRDRLVRRARAGLAWLDATLRSGTT